uniref:Putative hemomucin n=1 Tax=Amblyomma triste TaxID=251400 RepID=A0A023G5W9_AMBTT
MASWTSTAAVLVLLAGIQAVACDRHCNFTKATTCYWNLALAHGVEVFKPEHSVDFLQNICTTEQDLPEVSECSGFYDDCGKEEKEWFRDQENGYRLMQKRMTDAIMCKEARQLIICINTTALENCEVDFAAEYSTENAQHNDIAAKKLSKCLDYSLKPCTQKTMTAIKEYLKDIAKGVTELYTYKAPLTTPVPPSSTTQASTTTESPASTTQVSTSTPEPTTEGPTSHEPTTEGSTTHEPTSERPSTQSSTQAPTTPAPPSAAPSMHAVGAFSFIAFALLARGA